MRSSREKNQERLAKVRERLADAEDEGDDEVDFDTWFDAEFGPEEEAEPEIVPEETVADTTDDSGTEEKETKTKKPKFDKRRRQELLESMLVEFPDLKDGSWFERASCGDDKHDIGPDFFALERGASSRRIREFCGRCAVLEECQITGVLGKNNGMHHGGLSDKTRARVRDALKDGADFSEAIKITSGRGFGVPVARLISSELTKITPKKK